MISYRLSNTSINLPDLDGIPVPKTRAALEKGQKIAALSADAWVERDISARVLRDSPQLDQERLGRLYSDPDADTSEINPTELQDAAQKRADDAQAALTGRVQAEGIVLAELRGAIDAERDAWASIAKVNAAKAITKLTTATRMAEAARKDLAESIGVLGLLYGVGTTHNTIAVAQAAGGHSFDINPGIEHLRNAVAEASRELRDFKGMK